MMLTTIVQVKLLHTAIWLFFNVVIFYFLYTVITDNINLWTWVCLGLVGAEGIVLLIFKSICPVTLLARKYSDSTRHNFDIYLPEWLAKYNKLIYTSIMGIGVIFLCIRLLS